MSKFDVVIKGGTVIDGLRTPRYKADVGIAGGRVVAIGRVDASDGREVVDASGKVVAPGFVDLHTHYDSQVFWDPWCTMSGWHGVTSVVIGNCGFGFAPCGPRIVSGPCWPSRATRRCHSRRCEWACPGTGSRIPSSSTAWIARPRA